MENMIKASSRFVRTTPDKVRILAGLVKNKNIDNALNQLQFAGKYAAKPLSLVLKQAKAQIKDKNFDEATMIVKEVRVDEGPKLKRRRLRHQGRATAILKRMSHITIILRDNGITKSSEKITKQKEDTTKGSA